MKRSIRFLSKALGTSIENTFEAIEELKIEPDGYSNSEYSVPVYGDYSFHKLAVYLNSNAIDWYCDECGDFLNNQCGFNTYSRKWKCKNCGFINSITEDDIQ